MDGLGTGRGIACALVGLVVLLGPVDRAEALQAFDGRIEAHGFVEIQVRGLDRSFDEEFDLSQWYNVLNVELEFDILPDGWGPFDLVQAYIRAEGRYDCIYSTGCGMFPSVNTYGNHSRDLPLRLRDAELPVYSGVVNMTEAADPPGILPLVPEPGDPVGWSVNEIVETERSSDASNPNTYTVDLFNRCPPTRSPVTAAGLPSNTIPTASNPFPNEAGCIDNRPTKTEIVKRTGFPGFDTLFDLKGADGEIGTYQDYASMNSVGVLYGEGPNTFYNPAVKDGELEPPPTGDYYLDYAPLFRGFADERDDPAHYTLEPVADWQFTFRSWPGASPNGLYLPMGPWKPKNFFTTLAALKSKASPMRGRYTPTLMVTNGRTWKPDGTRYHELDCGKVLIPGTAPIDCNALPQKWLVDPVDPRLLELEDLLYAVGGKPFGFAQYQLSDPTLGTSFEFDPITGEPVYTPGTNLVLERYPNNSVFKGVFGDVLFGGDYSGIIPCWDTAKSIGNRTGLAENDAFIDQLTSARTSQGPVVGRVARSGCIPFTNVRVTGGDGELPMRVAPDFSNLSEPFEIGRAQGLYYPSYALLDYLEGGGEFDPHEFNISQIDRSFNRGASQRETYELKEAYLDLEFLESRLWIRAGIQNIVWGKTELFRTTDQFNPQDFALSSLPALEESRIALLSWRGVYSFYDVGPLEDVRFELAMNFDRFTPTDLGACGEPYTLDVVCGLTLGTAIHSVTGLGVAGFDRPPDGWEDVDGLEFGGRVEFRWDRFSFAIVDFYGYSDFPYPDVITYYERNVDPTSGMPRKGGATGSCANRAGFVATNVFNNGQPNDTKVLQGGNYALEIQARAELAAATAGGSQPAIDAAQANLNAVRPTGWGDPFASGELSHSGTDNLLAANDDWWRRKEAYTLLAIGTDPSCLKPGGAPGYANENQFDQSLAPSSADFFKDHPLNLYSNANAAGSARDTYNPATFIATSVGNGDGSTVQWTKAGESVDYSLRHHPANQELFNFICSATVSIAVALAPNACAWNLWGTDALLARDKAGPPFGDILSAAFAGPKTGQFYDNFYGAIIINTKGASLGAPDTIPLAPLSSDAGDGRTTSLDSIYGINARRLFFGTKYLKDTPRDPFDILTLDNSLTTQQKAFLGCGPNYGTRCDTGAAVVRVRIKDCTGVPGFNTLPYAVSCSDWADLAGTIDIEYERTALAQPLLFDIVKEPTNPNDPFSAEVCTPANFDDCRVWSRGGGIDFLNADASVVLQSFPGIEGTEGSTNSPGYNFTPWYTWAGDTAQPGTIGLVGLKGIDFSGDAYYKAPQPFDGPPACTVYAPNDPLANEAGVVVLPGCRGAVSAVSDRGDSFDINDNSIDVRFDTGYDPTVDGCVFGRSMSILNEFFFRETYWVRAVKDNGDLDEELQKRLYETCFNNNAPTIPGLPAGTPTAKTGTFSEPNPHYLDSTWYSFTRGTTLNNGELVSALQFGSGHRFHPTAQCEQARPGIVPGTNRLEDTFRPRGTGSTPEAQATTAPNLCQTYSRDFEADFILGNASVFKSELAAFSYNFLTFLVATSCNNVSGTDDLGERECFSPTLPWAVGRCSFSSPQFCRNVRGFLGVGGVGRNDPRAGGNERFGRRDFIWQSGADLQLRYARRNVFGISADFAEDNTKTNWGVEFTWIAATPWVDNNSMTSTTESDAINLTVSIDRPTFINFLNANRTFFFNTQWFFNYLPNYNKGFTSFGNPFNVLFTFAVFTGYYQDRLLPQLVTVYDFSSQSGGFLPQLGYRFTEAFSVTFGVSFFIGKNEYVPMPIRGFAPRANRAGPHKYQDGVNRLLANFMRRDEAWMRLRWTF